MATRDSVDVTCFNESALDAQTDGDFERHAFGAGDRTRASRPCPPSGVAHCANARAVARAAGVHLAPR